MKNKREIGFKFEDIVREFLERENFLFVENNYYTKYGEIDLIFLEKSTKTLVFIEVKYRKKQERIIKSSQVYIFKNKWKDNVRYDIVGITGNGLKNDINWIKNAF